MATKIRRSLYIGLGGTGMNALLHTKKMFIDTYGEVPPMIGFLGIDTDNGVYKKTIKALDGKDICLTANEQLPLPVNGAKDIFQINRESFSWIPQANERALHQLKGKGAGQVRTNGRFALTVNRDNIINAIRRKLRDITDAHIIDNTKYELLAADSPEIHMIFSICGGTGAGTFINVAYLAREAAPQDSKLNAYAVLPEIFEAMSTTGMEKVKPNAYGSLLDLDYLMHRSWGDTPISIEYLNGHSATIDERPFDSVVFINNQNRQSDTYKHIDQLTEMISLALVTASGELSVEGASIGDNLSILIDEGDMDIENKSAWAGGMGACEIVYRGEKLADIYRLKAAKRLIDDILTGSTSDSDIIANAWIDAPEVKIRENNNHDDVINFIDKATPKFPFTINNKNNVDAEVQTSKNINEIKQDDIDKKVNELHARIQKELRSLIVKHINSKGGITLAKDILTSIKAQIKICYNEMVAEKAKFEEHLPSHEGAINTHINKIRSSRWGVRDACNSLCDTVKLYNTTKREIQRRQAAISVYNGALVLIDDTLKKIESIESKLKGAKTSLQNSLSEIQASVENNGSIFQINLAANDAKKVEVNLDEIIIDNFITKLAGELKIYNLDIYSSTEIEQILLDYTYTLDGAKAYANKGVEQVFMQMIESGDNGVDEFKSIIRRAIGKSAPLFHYNYQGYFSEVSPSDILYIGVYDKDNSILKDSEYIEEEVQGCDNISYASVGMKDKVIIYRQVGVVPVYAINGIDEYYKKYSENSISFHFDANVYDKMQREEFRIMPVKKNDNDLLDLWVKGFIYGLIKNESGCYYMKSESLGDYLDDYWVKLSAWRHEAYDIFKSKSRTILQEFTAYINKKNEQMGGDAVAQLIANAKSNYYDDFSQVRVNKSTLKQKGYERVAELIKQEGAHVLKKL